MKTTNYFVETRHFGNDLCFPAFLTWCVLLASLWMANLAIADDLRRMAPMTKPDDVILFEASKMKIDGSGWQVKPYTPDLRTAGTIFMDQTANPNLLIGDAEAKGIVKQEIIIPKDGRYHIWVRYLDVTVPAGQPRRPFQVRAMQGGQPAGTKDFDTVGLRLTPEATSKWSMEGDWGTSFVWDSMEADLKAGPCVVEMSNVPPLDAGAFRLVDGFAVTGDLNYQPNLHDFSPPLYLKVVMGKTGNPKPVFLHFDGNFVGHHDVTKTGLYAGLVSDDGYGPERWLQAGDESPWVNIAPLLPQFSRFAFGGSNDQLIWFDAMTGYMVYAPETDYTLLFSHTPSEEGLIKKFHRSGPGGGIRLFIDKTKVQDISSEIEWSQRLRAAVEKVPPTPGRQPKEFPLITALYHELSRNPNETIENDIATVEDLGFSGTMDSLIDAERLHKHGLKFNSSTATTFSAAKDSCFNQIDWEAVRKHEADNLKNYAPGDVQWIRLMDEASVEMDHLQRCPVCLAKFREYLRGQGFSEADAAKAQLDFDKTKNPKLFYHQVLYRDQLLVDNMKHATEIVHSINPKVDTICNPSTELTSYENLLTRGYDWFTMFKEKGLTYGFVEDGNTCTPSQQTISYMMDFLRSACKYHDLPYGVFNIMWSRPAWEVGAKAFTEVGHGAHLLNFYNWGPYHIQSSDCASQRPELYPVLKEFNFAVGAVEKEILQAKPVASKVAFLYSPTTDIWDITSQGNVLDLHGFNAEMMDLYLLMRHLGYPIDILTEDDVLEGRAKDYEALFVTGDHLKDGVLAKVLDWTKAGGFLYLGPGAGEFNQFNEPLKDLAAAGLKRDPYKFVQTPGHEDYLPLMQVVAKVNDQGQTFNGVGGYQKVAKDMKGKTLLQFEDGTPASTELEYGKGHILFVGFFAGLSYAREACIPMSADRAKRRAEGKPILTWDPPAYPEEYHTLFRKLLQPLDWKPPVEISKCLVEGSLLGGPKAYVLALANWAGGVPQKITVSATLPGKLGKPFSVINPLSDVKMDGNTVRFSMNVGRGDFIVIPRDTP